MPAWVPLGLGAASVWLFHYGQTGLRAVTAPERVHQAVAGDEAIRVAFEENARDNARVGCN